MTNAPLTCLGIFQDLKAPQESGVIALHGGGLGQGQPTLRIAVRTPRHPVEYLGPAGWQGQEHWWSAGPALLLWEKVVCIGLGSDLTQHMEPGVVEFGVHAGGGATAFLRVVWPDRLPPFDESALRETAAANHLLDAPTPSFAEPEQPPPTISAPPLPADPQPPPQPPETGRERAVIPGRSAMVPANAAMAAVVIALLLGGAIGTVAIKVFGASTVAAVQGTQPTPTDAVPELVRLLQTGPTSPRGIEMPRGATARDLWARAQDARKVGDGAETAHWLRLCSLEGERLCLATLAYLYLDGTQVEKNLPAGLLLLQVAGVLGEPNAYYNLGAIYEDGEYVGGRDLEMAKFYFQKAKAKGHAESVKALDRLK